VTKEVFRKNRQWSV